MANRRRLIADGAPSLHITHPMCQHDNHDEYDDEDDDDHADDQIMLMIKILPHHHPYIVSGVREGVSGGLEGGLLIQYYHSANSDHKKNTSTTFKGTCLKKAL